MKEYEMKTRIDLEIKYPHGYNINQPAYRIKTHTPRNKLEEKFIKGVIVMDDDIKVTTELGKQYHKQDLKGPHKL